MSKAVILSIHPKWAEKIYSGEKAVEWRKTFPKIYYPRMKIYIYETASICKVTGYFVWAGTHKFKDVDWTQANEHEQKFINAGCVPAEELNEYQGHQKQLCGWGVEKAHKFEKTEGLPLEYFGLTTPPQSWSYTNAR